MQKVRFSMFAAGLIAVSATTAVTENDNYSNASVLNATLIATCVGSVVGAITGVFWTCYSSDTDVRER